MTDLQKPRAKIDPRAGQARIVALVIAGTMLLWMGAQWLGGQMGWPARYVFLFDLAALAAFTWALVVTYQIWRGRQG
ncbi:DUF5337 domain-containing protein [Pseudogemmobacter blasticus]|uniref:DUF5337 domain-containing protein n=1 Tax=Fuscovulum blasticum DSM 2131 TaxID=1188250 RepID=A0A2T4J9Z8_FUSBL|nr:DUF5337 domain-containing protein [Fuscovulum blasticum]PTE14736.1 hypothetical protein C5F44_07970 [Fuscovulum blasticum DSM 2131]